MPSQDDLEHRLQQWYRDQMACGYYLYQYSVRNPALLRVFLSLLKSSTQNRSNGIESLSRPVLQHSPHLALSMFNLNYRQISYTSSFLPYHLLYRRVFRMIHQIKGCSSTEVFHFLTGMAIDPLYATLLKFLEDVTPLFASYTDQLFQRSPKSASASRIPSRTAIIHAMRHYQISYGKTSQDLYHDLLHPVYRFMRDRHWIPLLRIVVNYPTLFYFSQPNSIFGTFPLADQIMIVLPPSKMVTHADALQQATFFTHELGHALHIVSFMVAHRPMPQLDSYHPEMPACLCESFFTLPTLTRQYGIEPQLADDIAFYANFLTLMQCIKETSRVLTLLECFRLPVFTRDAFNQIVTTYFRRISHSLGYVTTIPPMLNSYSLFYHLESLLGHWATGVNSIDHIPDLATAIPVTLDYQPFLRKKRAFLETSF